MALPPTSRRTIGMEKQHNFRAHPDPIIERICSEVRASSLSASAVADRARLSPTTLHNLLIGKTLRPHHATLDQIMAVLGLRFEIVIRKIADPQPVDYTLVREAISRMRDARASQKRTKTNRRAR